MTDTQDRLERIAECERRIALAFDRIGISVEDILTRPVTEDEPDPRLAQLQAELQAERLTNTQLSDRVRALGEKQQTTLATLERRLAQAEKVQTTLQTELVRFKRLNLDLVAANKRLLDGREDGVEQALLTEVQALRATRDLEAEEISAVIAGIEPLISDVKAEDTNNA